MWNSGCRGQVWFSRVSQSLQCPSGALPASLQVMRTWKSWEKTTHTQALPMSGYQLKVVGGEKPGIGMDKSSGHPRHSALASFTLQSWPQSDTPKLPTSLPLGHFSYTDYHILDLPHSITGPLPHFPIRSPSPPSHSCSQQSEASVHSVYIALGPEGSNRDWVFTSSLPPQCQRASWVFFFFEQGV